MCCVIDVNAIPAVFDLSNAKHEDFGPVLKWLVKGRGKFVYGGTTYKRELSKLRKYLGALTELDRIGKRCELPDGPIDACEGAIKEQLKANGFGEGDRRYNDAHIVAILAQHRVRVVCTCDKSSHGFLKDAAFYDNSTHRPRIYGGKEHEPLLCDANIAPCCQ